MNKKGLIQNEIIFIILNLVFFAVMLIFIFSNANGKPVYEQAYAKQIAFLIDEAKPLSTISVDFSEMIEKYEINPENKEDIVSLDENKVIIKFGDKGGKSFMFFTDAKISNEFQGNYLIIKVEEK